MPTYMSQFSSTTASILSPDPLPLPAPAAAPVRPPGPAAEPLTAVSGW